MVPAVCTSGASGPSAPPDAMPSSDTGINERSERTSVGAPGHVDVVHEEFDVTGVAQDDGQDRDRHARGGEDADRGEGRVVLGGEEVLERPQHAHVCGTDEAADDSDGPDRQRPAAVDARYRGVSTTWIVLRSILVATSR